MSQQIFRVRFFYSAVCFLLERRELNLGRTWANHRRSQYFFNMLICFETRARPRRLGSKIDAKFRIFAPPPFAPCKNYERDGRKCLSKFYNIRYTFCVGWNYI